MSFTKDSHLKAGCPTMGDLFERIQRAIEKDDVYRTQAEKKWIRRVKSLNELIEAKEMMPSIDDLPF